jgi:hypothetical protein
MNTTAHWPLEGAAQIGTGTERGFMCKAFSCLVTIDRKVTWKMGMDSHTDLVNLAGYKDQTADPHAMEFARIEITPDNNNYLYPDAWTLKVDEQIKPSWLVGEHEEVCLAAHKKWLKQLDKLIIRKALVLTFKVNPPAKITKQHIALLKQWASVRDSVWASVRASVRDSVGAYTGSFFVIKQWKYIKHPAGEYPFAPCVKLWEKGLVPSFDGKTWRLHGGERAAILFEISAEKLRGEGQ